ncbi:ABC transporter permease [Brooklawnia cerclae]|uniref:ABC transport system permease protein n=1 Tax=Brooklawnia cerclae TaxID=349934 RepID=A0ABX0SP73_9ACTN|nr:FtsX-like permease family protein [Brooklawnia cerclae]NIH58845.1 putative ABC transport system permease protein [Brooklawnia cerclae]
MWKAAWKSVLGHPARFILSILAVVLGIAFMVGALTFTGMIQQSFDSITRGTIADVDISPEGTYDTETTVGTTAQPAPLTEADLDAVRAVDGVESAEGVISTMGVYPLDASGHVTTTGGAPSIGSTWLDAPAFGHQPGIVLKSGSAPSADDEVAIDPVTFDGLGLSLGDEVELATEQGIITKTVVGTATWGSGGTIGAQYTFFTTAEAQRLFLDGQDGFQQGWVTVDEGADRAAVAEAVDAVLPDGYAATDGQVVADQVAGYIQTAMGFINTFLLVFAGIGLVVAVFLIANTFSILVAQRGRELALFRALGASRRQVGRSVLFEAFVIGLAGSLLGIVVGALLAWGISAAMSAYGMDMSGTRPIPSIAAVVAAMVVGVSVTMVSAWLPSRRAGRIPPVAAMTGQLQQQTTRFGKAEVVAVVLTVIGLGAIVVGTEVLEENQAYVVGVGAVLMLVGVAGLAPLIGRPLTWLLGRLFRVLFHQTGKLADLNTVRQPRRTAATASALMIGLALVTALSVLGSSASESMERVVRDGVRSDFQISSVGYDGIPSKVADLAADVPGVSHVTVVREGYTQTEDGGYVSILGYAPEDFNRLAAQEIVDGRMFTTAVDEAIITQDMADEDSLGVGDSLEIPNLATGQSVTFDIVGVFSTPDGIGFGSINTNVQTMESLGMADTISDMAIEMDPGADRATVHEGLDDAVAEFPTVTVLDKEEYVDQQTAQIDSMLNMVYALLALAIVIAVLGIINTLVLSTIERTRELGLLRAVGMKRGQIRLMVTLESVSIAVLGATLGMILGLIFGTALQRVLADSGLTSLVIPMSRLVAFLAASVVVGILAAVWPAQRAAGLKILDAIAHE